MFRLAILMMLIAVFLSGCAEVQDFGSSLKYNIQGEYYLQDKKFEKGRETFLQAVKNDPNNAEAQYYYGRFLLAENNVKKGLGFLKRAVELNPGVSEYHFWLGLAYGESGKQKLERKSYLKALELDPRNIQALTYMGNSLLGSGEYVRALPYYEKVLDQWNYSPQALYNRAVILRKLRRVPEEKLAWLHYLDAYPSGSFARLAADRLNSLGDHSYRNYRLGIRTITLAEIAFVPFTAELSSSAYPSLDVLGASLANMNNGTLDILVYQLNNLSLAKERALSIRRYLENKYPEFKKNKRIRTSWFDVAEKRTLLGKRLSLDESVQFFLTVPKK